MTHKTFDVDQYLRDHGLRVTPQRSLILDTLCDGERHMTFGEVYAGLSARGAPIDRSTLYRALDVFIELGLVVRGEALTEGTVYELAGPTPHHHLMCTNCGDEIQLGAGALQGLTRRLDDEYCFQLHADHLVFRGLCANCREKPYRRRQIP